MKKIGKKGFPKIQKSLKKFLTDESWKITKKGALWIWLWWAIIWGIDHADAAHYHSNVSNHSSGSSHYNHTSGRDDDHSNGPRHSSHNSWNSRNLNVYYDPGVCNVNHHSWIVNGHHSGTPSWSVSGTRITNVTWHVNHSNHWSGGWC